MWEIATLGNSLTFTYFASCVACVYVCLFIYLFIYLGKGHHRVVRFRFPPLSLPHQKHPLALNL